MAETHPGFRRSVRSTNNTFMKITIPIARRFCTAALLITAGLGLASLSLSRARNPVPPPAPPSAIDDTPPPPADRRGERPPPPPPHGKKPRGPRPDDAGDPPPPPPDAAPARPVGPQAAPAAVKLVTVAAADFAPGEVWLKTGPRGDRHLEASVLYQSKEIARLAFNPADGAVLPKGLRALPPAPAEQVQAQPPPAPSNGSAGDLERLRLADIVKNLRVAGGAEVMPREGFWRVPLIFQGAVVADVQVAGDGARILPDLGAARDAAIFAAR